MQFAHQLGSLDVDRVLLLYLVRLITGDKGEPIDIFVQVFKGEFVLCVLVQIIQPKSRKVGNQQIARQFRVFQPGEIIQCLLVGAVEVFAA